MSRPHLFDQSSSSTLASSSHGPSPETPSFTTVPTAEDPLTFYIQNSDIPDGAIHHMNEPLNEIPTAPPVALRRPNDPVKRTFTLKILEPCIFYVQFPCDLNCRSMGICIHFQFVIGAKKCPDGLRCDICVKEGVEEAITANRKCPLHQIRNQANPISSRPEDFLANQTQKAVCEEILLRSVFCQWDDLSPGPTLSPGSTLAASPNPGAHGNVQGGVTHLQDTSGFENDLGNEAFMGFNNTGGGGGGMSIGGGGSGNDAQGQLMDTSELEMPIGYAYATGDN